MASLSDVINSRRSFFESVAQQDTNAYRIFKGSSDGIPGWIVDRFGPVAWIQWREGECAFSWEEAKKFSEEVLKETRSLGVSTVFLKRFVPDRSSLTQSKNSGSEMEWQVGEPIGESVVATENGVRFHIYPAESYSPGLFLDQRNNRTWARENAEKRRVLNLFCYSGAFSVFAALGGASEVTSVDVSKRWIERARGNFTLNGLPVDAHRFFATGAMSFLSTAIKRGEKYDLVLIDPPSFSRSDRDGVFSLKVDRHRLWELASQVISPKGVVFFSTNWQQTSAFQLEREMSESFPPTEWKRIELPHAPGDFAGSDNPITNLAFRALW